MFMILLLPYTFIQLCHHISQISFVLQQIEFYEFPGGRRTTLFHTFCIFVNSEFCTYFHKSIFAYLFWYVNVIVNLIHLCFFWKKIIFPQREAQSGPFLTFYGTNVKNLTLGFSPKFSFRVTIHMEKSGKNLGPKFIVKFFTLDPYTPCIRLSRPFPICLIWQIWSLFGRKNMFFSGLVK